MFARPVIATATVLAIAALLYITAASAAPDRMTGAGFTLNEPSVGALADVEARRAET